MGTQWCCLVSPQEKSILLQTAIESNNNKASWVSVIQVRTRFSLVSGLSSSLFGWG